MNGLNYARLPLRLGHSFEGAGIVVMMPDFPDVGDYGERLAGSPVLERSCSYLCRCPCSGLAGHRVGLFGFAIGFLAWLANVNRALEVSAVFDADTLRHHVAGERAFAPDVH